VTDTQKGYLDDEFQSLRNEIDRIGAQTKWNDRPLLDGAGGPSGTAKTYKFQVGASATTIDVEIDKADTSATGIFKDIEDVAGGVLDIKTEAKASPAIAKIDLALAASNTARSKIGAAINRLTYAADNLSNISMNTAASRSRIEDTDYAAASTELARTQIIQQAATAMLAQANQAPQSVLALLK
jgi:flagellin